MKHQIPIDASASALSPQDDATREDGTHQVRPDLARKRAIVAKKQVLFGTAHEISGGTRRNDHLD